MMRPTYTWVMGQSNAGKIMRVGPFPNEREAEANSIVQKLHSVRYFELPTRDKNRASQMIKTKLAGQRNVPVDHAMGRFGRRLNEEEQESYSQREEPRERFQDRPRRSFLDRIRGRQDTADDNRIFRDE